jgi:hypothetical protein
MTIFDCRQTEADCVWLLYRSNAVLHWKPPLTDVCADPKRATLISNFRGVFAIAAIFF